MSRGERIRSEPDRHRDSEVCQPCPPPPRPPAKRRSSEREEGERRSEVGKAAAAEQQSKLDRKQKSSVFSRISFPETEKETKTKRTSSLLDVAVTSGVIKDHRHQRSHRDRGEEASVFGHREGSVASSGRGHRRSSYEHEPSEEEDEDYHFKRRP